MTRPRHVVLRAPLSGGLVALEQVPDPVFSQRIVGDGISIDPTSTTLLAPCDGRVAQLHPSGHAITLATPDGAEVMLHIGLDTVKLKGQGFTPRVAVGADVRVGEPLIEFDRDYVAGHARSLLTQVVITSGARVVMAGRAVFVTAGEDPILEIAVDGASPGGPPGSTLRSAPVVVPNPDGLHARPAAALAACARAFAAELTIEYADRRANARSVVALMRLEVPPGEAVHVLARGPDAAEASRTLVALIAAGAGEESSLVGAGASTARVHGEARLARSSPAASRRVATSPGELAGIAAAPGLAVGTIVQVAPTLPQVDDRADDRRVEHRRFEDAVARARGELATLRDRLAQVGEHDKAALFGAQEALLEDPAIVESARAAIEAGHGAAFAWRGAVTAQADALGRARSELVASRAADVRDVGQRVLRAIAGVPATPPTCPAGCVLVAEDLTPSDIATLDRSAVAGFCTVGGGATSHVAILARSFAIPAIVGMDPRILDLPDGTTVILDGNRGVLRLDPSAADLAMVEDLHARQAARRRVDVEAALTPATTRDGHSVDVAANAAAIVDAERAVAAGADGIGLLRSEFLFVGRTAPPSEDEQAAIYEAMARTLGIGRPLVVRLLDIGGDKPMACLPMRREDNPFLGERGIRAMLARPDVLRPQVRAILRASRAGDVHAMVPMVATLEEWRAVRAVFDEEQARLGVASIPLGMMVEVPSAALQAEAFAADVEFFSIGTNDLTQYTLAMDRSHPTLASKVDALHPAVLRLIASTVDGARRYGRWVGVCGGLAGDEQAVPILVGLGVDELSVPPPAVPAIKACVRTLDRSACVDLATRALQAPTAAAVRALVPFEFD